MQGGRHPADAGQRLGAEAAQRGHRHAVGVAGGGQLVGVEVGVGVQPQHAQGLAGGAAVACHRADRANRQAVVAAHQNGKAALHQRAVHGGVHHLVPDHHLGQVAVAVDGRLLGVARPGQVATVGDVEAAPPQRFNQSGHAQGFRPHGRAAHTRADVGGRANQVNGSVQQSRGGVGSHAGRDFFDTVSLGNKAAGGGVTLALCNTANRFFGSPSTGIRSICSCVGCAVCSWCK